MKATNRNAIRLYCTFFLALGIFIFIIAYNREFKDNNYKFDFSNMNNPEHALIMVFVSVVVLILTVIIRKKVDE